MPDGRDLLNHLADLEDTAYERLLARLSILRCVARHRAAEGLSDLRAQEEVAERYAEQQAAVPAWVYDVYDSVTARTLRRWEERVQDGGLAGLTDDHGRRSARSYESYFGPGTEMRRIAFYYLADHPGSTSTDVIEALAEHFDAADLPDKRTVQRFLRKMRA